MPITLRSVRSNVDIGGISRAFANAQAGINAGLGNLQNTATGVGVKKDEDALKSFRDSIAGASVDDLSNFDVDAAAKGSRLGASQIQGLIDQNLGSARNAEINTNSFNTSRRNAREEPLRAQANALAQAGDEAGLNKFLSENQIQDTSGILGNLQSAQDRNTRKAYTEENQSYARKARNEAEAAKQRGAAISGTVSGFLNNAPDGYTDVDFKKQVQSSDAFKSITDISERNKYLEAAMGAYGSAYTLTTSQQEQAKKLDEKTKQEFDIQLGELNTAKMRLGERPGSALPLTKSENRSKVKNSAREFVDSVFEGSTDRIGVTTGKGVLDIVNKYIDQGFETEGGVKYSPEDIDGGVLLDALKEAHENPKENILFSAGMYRKALPEILARSIEANKKYQVDWDAKNFALDTKFNLHKRGILDLPKKGAPSLAQQLEEAVTTKKKTDIREKIKAANTAARKANQRVNLPFTPPEEQAQALQEFDPVAFEQSGGDSGDLPLDQLVKYTRYTANK